MPVGPDGSFGGITPQDASTSAGIWRRFSVVIAFDCQFDIQAVGGIRTAQHELAATRPGGRDWGSRSRYWIPPFNDSPNHYIGWYFEKELGVDETATQTGGDASAITSLRRSPTGRAVSQLSRMVRRISCKRSAASDRFQRAASDS
jgi:hypothetical protein